MHITIVRAGSSRLPEPMVKTTTTALVGEIMKNYFDSVYVVGNIGTSVTSVALETTEDSVIVAEMSSFQLETIHRFHPSVCAIMNITPISEQAPYHGGIY